MLTAKRHLVKRHLVNLLKADALRLGEFTLTSGRKSHYYVDCRKVTLTGRGINEIAILVQDVLDGAGFGREAARYAIGGTVTGADPIVGAMLVHEPTWAGFLVRKEAKQHGTGQLIEGPLEAGMRVVIVDDVATTGGSAMHAVRAARAAGCTVDAVIVVLDRLEGAAGLFAAEGIPFHALATIQDLGVEPLMPQ